MFLNSELTIEHLLKLGIFLSSRVSILIFCSSLFCSSFQVADMNNDPPDPHSSGHTRISDISYIRSYVIVKIAINLFYINSPFYWSHIPNSKPTEVFLYRSLISI